MTALDAIRWVDGKKHNVYSQEDKLFWLGQVEAMASRLHCRCGREQEQVQHQRDTTMLLMEIIKKFNISEIIQHLQSHNL